MPELSTPQLHTARLCLRPVQLSDAPALQRHFSDWAIISNLTTNVHWPYPPDGTETFLREVMLPRVRQGLGHAWALVPKGQTGAVGLLEYRVGDLTDNRGFWIAREYWGQGLMTEAVTAFQDWVFGQTDVDQIFVCNAKSNIGSRRVKQKTGAVLVGMMSVLHHTGESECERWVVTREAWQTAAI